MRELLSSRRTPFVNDWANTLARITALESMAAALMGVTSSIIDNIDSSPTAQYDAFVDNTHARLSGLESLAESIMGISSSIIDNIDSSDLPG